MKNFTSHIKSPALISFLVTLPFIILEKVNRPILNEGFPFLLFGILWLLSAIFILILVPTMRNFQAENKFSLIIQIALLFIIAIIWFSIVKDQLPCFLGVPNCD